MLTEQRALLYELAGKVVRARSISGTTSVDFKAAQADRVCLKTRIGCELFIIIALGHAV